MLCGIPTESNKLQTPDLEFIYLDGQKWSSNAAMIGFGDRHLNHRDWGLRPYSGQVCQNSKQVCYLPCSVRIKPNYRCCPLVSSGRRSRHRLKSIIKPIKGERHPELSNQLVQDAAGC